MAGALGAVSAPVRAASPAGKYVVQQGDTLSGIAAQLNVRGGWPALYAANRQIIGPDPDLIMAGTVLVLPGQHGPVRYTSRPVTPCRASRPRWRYAAAGRLCTRPTARSSARIRA